MARTKASVGAKVSFGKSSKAQKSAAPVASTSGTKSKSSSKNAYSGGNSYCPRETPNWQLPITRFFAGGNPDNEMNGGSSGSSRLQPNGNASDESSERIEFDDLDRTASSEVELLPIVDDGTSHKIGEFFTPSDLPKSESNTRDGQTKNKGKGKGKKNKLNDSADKSSDSKEAIQESKNKENMLPEDADAQPSNGIRKRSLVDCGVDSDSKINIPKKVRISNS